MRCSDARSRAAENEALDPSTAEAVAAHLAQCPACAAAVAEQRLAVLRLRSLPLREPPAGLEGRLLALPSAVAAPTSLAPVVAERFVWLVLAAVAALSAWGLWRARLIDPGGLQPASPFPLVAHEQGSDGANRRADAPPPSQPLTGDAIAFGTAPTAVARLHRLDLRRQPDTVTLAGEAGRVARPGRSPRGLGPGAGVASSAPTAEGDGGAPVPPASGDGGRQASRPQPGQNGKPPEATALPTAVPAGAPTQPTASACTTVTFHVRVMADVAGGLDAQCAGCDGQFDDLDRASLAASLTTMPPMQVGIFSAVDPDLADEVSIEPNDPRYYTEAGDVTAILQLCLAPRHWPIVAQLHLLPGGVEQWSGCPSTGLETTMNDPNATTATFALRPTCPRPAPPPVAATATAEPYGAAASGVGATGSGPESSATAAAP